MHSSAASSRRRLRRLATGLAFAGPNVLGFLAFTLIPMLFSMALAFSNWDLKLHNQFKSEPIKFVGISNFIRLFTQPEFFRFLGNTLFFMMGIPVAIALSLLAAVELSQYRAGGSRKNFFGLMSVTVLGVCIVMLALIGSGSSAMSILLGGLVCLMLIGGVAGGNSVYRTLFYVPSFTSGVAVLILWKRLFNSQTGPVNAALSPLLDSLAAVVRQTPAPIFSAAMWLCFGGVLLILALGLIRLRLMWRDGDVGRTAALVSATVLLIPFVIAARWSFTSGQSSSLRAGAVAISLWQLLVARRHGVDFPSSECNRLGSAWMLCGALLAAQMALLGLAPVLGNLPGMASDGLAPPSWLTDYHWAKPALMIMGLWGAIGSQNMLLYIAALSNVPPELYEAANIDGATRLQRFWHVTWPQLAPTTFFIVVMSVIGGLQGGFETARTMTSGGPAGATTTLSYFIYIEGFETGRLGYSSAVAWTLFAMVLAVTILNVRVGSRYVND